MYIFTAKHDKVIKMVMNEVNQQSSSKIFLLIFDEELCKHIHSVESLVNFVLSILMPIG
jgi:hypothetical protein